MYIKVCGLTQPEQLQAIGTTADFTGMIFHPPSQRYIGEYPPEGYKPERIHAQKTGVFVNETEERMQELAGRFQLNAIQLHGEETPELCKRLRRNYTLIKVFRIHRPEDFKQTAAYAGVADYFLFDTAGKLRGGNGIKFNWELLNHYHASVPFFLSGGITPEDGAWIKQLPHKKLIGVDINSGFETAPGIKDLTQVQRFIREMRGEPRSFK